jgi:hypothetical protein
MGGNNNCTIFKFEIIAFILGLWYLMPLSTIFQLYHGIEIITK